MSHQNPPLGERLVICIGDIHGFYSKLQKLWSNLECHINPSQFSNALIIFLGDYCDRGPDTKRVIDFLVSLPSRYPYQKHVFLCGNHDFAFAAFLGVLPKPLNGLEFREGWKLYAGNEEVEGWYKGDGYENMHLQGRKWVGSTKVKFNEARGIHLKGSVKAGPTFESYGVPYGSPDLIKVVPDDHKKFIADLVWVHEETAEGLKQCKLIAVHSGLQQGIPIDKQLKLLRARDTSMPEVECLTGRKSTWYMPEELKASPTLVVSGHHGKFHIEGLRMIIDECGGNEHQAMAAIILPSMKVVRDTD